jgi:MYXO-CTERM domain-containing protein
MGACDAGFGDCDQDPATGCEVELALDAQNCGACGTVCSFAHAAASCAESACVLGACDAGFGDCDQDPATGCEAELALDAQNCGACGTVCSFAHAAASCAANACALGACDAGYDNCDADAANGCEVILDTDAANCGECGHACGAEETCQAGDCVSDTCDAGLADCNQDPADGCEVTLATDAANCGQCGHACEAGQACVASECQACADADQDGFLDAACGGDDCLDSNADVNPDATEVCDNQLDDDCDGDTDADDSDCGDGDDGGGCGCASSGSDTPAWAGLALALGLLVSRRRARK